MSADPRITRAGSIPFDSAADYYDRTRAISPEAEVAVVGLLREELAGRGAALEIGVGTGRIGRPLRAADSTLIGLDLSRPMLARLVANAGGSPPFPLTEGDCVHLPFRDGVFGGVIASHVFHLVPAWTEAVAEARRVLAAGGVLLATRGGWQGLKHEVATRFTEESGFEKPPVVGLDLTDDLDEYLGSRGVRVRHLPVVTDRQQVTLDGLISVLERGQLAWMWTLEPEVLTEAGRRTRAWAESEYGSLGQRREQVSQIAWRAYDLT